MSRTHERLTTLFRDIFDDPKIEIDRETDSSRIENWDSLAHIQLIAAIEVEFKIRFALAEIQELKNVGQMMDLIDRKIKA